ncbi:SDR family NAD(P)-dependent oxidoreductase [Streptomyces profundus]|uniref:SDR family NAD(P)-dependent oxidoreductase n=1 Tax=Streptomyces profundus TaxID=2867410 RepID=UPI001D161406|nr:SDR family NAD(P)-dependent oxidoreductase [Streptomyces sp. MA3_2.13]UED88031.1 SDR family oxidoreductase [Streptomyces sp. MA3_2.13]
MTAQDGFELFSVQGRTALVTGGARGVGALIAQALVEAGAEVYVTSRDVAAAEKTAARLSLFGDCFPLAADLATERGCRDLAESLGGRVDRLNLLVNNAGALHTAPLDDFDDAGWDTVLQVNLRAVFHLTRFLRPTLEAAARVGDPARVVNIGSIDGLRAPAAEIYSYAASKAAMHHLTLHLAGRLAPRIAVNALALGPFESAMSRDALADDIGRRSPLRRAGGLDDLAGVMRFLGSRSAAYLTGTVIPFDGGLSATR